MTNREQIEKLIKALRSGKYKQTKSKLHGDEGFCCIGVYGVEVLGKRKEDIYSSGAERACSFHISDTYDKFGNMISSFVDHEKNQCYISMFASMNDDGKSFEKIADKLQLMLDNSSE